MWCFCEVKIADNIKVQTMLLVQIIFLVVMDGSGTEYNKFMNALNVLLLQKKKKKHTSQ